MVARTKTSISIPKTLCDQVDILAQSLEISRNQLVEIAIEDFINNHQRQTQFDESSRSDVNEDSGSSHQDTKPMMQIDEERLVINQGDLYWVQLGDLSEGEAGIRHPFVVIQDNVFNHSRIDTVVACALTSNMKRANLPGNVLLEIGEANLPKQSVVEVSKASTVHKTQLGEYIGSLNARRIEQILDGMRFLQLSFFAR
jgi:mRNA interferase MazF